MGFIWTIWTMILLSCFLKESEGVQCFSRFTLGSGQCEEEIGEVEDVDDCCQNTDYGYHSDDGECMSCGPTLWSPWSSWSQCSVLCGEGVRQRRRQCYGISSDCPDDQDFLQTEPCRADTCCTAVVQWEPWGPWTPCTEPCGGVAGVRERERVCSRSEDTCQQACEGPANVAEACVINAPCPVHGGWSGWSQWGVCSSTCTMEGGAYPTKTRRRECSNPAPSVDTVPPGNACQEPSEDSQNCSELPNCPVDGSWGPWGPPGPCSVSCEEGLQLSIRLCNRPAPKYGGSYCKGESAKSIVCSHACPVHGSWTGWSSWGECSTSCFPESQSSTRTRVRSCSNPAPSTSPPGNSCPGDRRETQSCNHLQPCQVAGSWGPWSEYSSCSVTCGVGLQQSLRECNSPAPKHGGSPCLGASRRTIVCNTKVHCPVDGVWEDWSPWSNCVPKHGSYTIDCKTITGKQNRTRRCQYRAYGGAFCPSESTLDVRPCYNIHKCRIKGSWAGWSEWSLCLPVCGANQTRKRKRICEPDLTNYQPFYRGNPVEFHGTPQAGCLLPPGEKREEGQPCLNVPRC